MNGELGSPEGRKDGLVCGAEREKRGTGGMGEPGEGSRSEVRGYRNFEPRRELLIAPFPPVSRFTRQKLWRGYAHSSRLEMSLLFPQRNLDHHTAHDIIHLKVFLRAARMGIVTADTGLADGSVRVDGFEI